MGILRDVGLFIVLLFLNMLNINAHKNFKDLIRDIFMNNK